jgi:hypothetical protein
MFNIKIILLKNENPSCQLPSKLIGLHKPLQWLVIIHQGELATKLITPKCGKDPNNYKTFPFILPFFAFTWLLD